MKTCGKLEMINSLTETGEKWTGHNLSKNDIVIGHDKNWLEPTRSKMVEDLTSSGP